MGDGGVAIFVALPFSRPLPLPFRTGIAMVAFAPLFRITLGDGVRSKVGASGALIHGGDIVRVVRSGGGEMVNDGGGETAGLVAGGSMSSFGGRTTTGG